MRPIETKYKGYRFRSRLEARWAVCFDFMRIRWEYEPEGFVTPFGPYLPDFWLPDWGVYAEVKPEKCERTDDDRVGYLKAQTFAGHVVNAPIIGLIGTPEVSWYPTWVPVSEWGDRLPDPRGVSLEWLDFSMSVSKGRPWYFYGGSERPDPNALSVGSESDPFVLATLAARGARFEHGETPA